MYRCGVCTLFTDTYSIKTSGKQGEIAGNHGKRSSPHHLLPPSSEGMAPLAFKRIENPRIIHLEYPLEASTWSIHLESSYSRHENERKGMVLGRNEKISGAVVIPKAEKNVLEMRNLPKEMISLGGGMKVIDIVKLL